jgi:hypothetical protein
MVFKSFFFLFSSKYWTAGRVFFAVVFLLQKLERLRSRGTRRLMYMMSLEGAGD